MRTGLMYLDPLAVPKRRLFVRRGLAYDLGGGRGVLPRAGIPGIGEDGVELAVGHQRRVCRLVVPVLDHGLSIAVGHLLRDACRRRVLRGHDDLVSHAEHLEESERDGLRHRDLFERHTEVLEIGAEVGRRLAARVEDVGRLASALL